MDASARATDVLVASQTGVTLFVVMHYGAEAYRAASLAAKWSQVTLAWLAYLLAETALISVG